MTLEKVMSARDYLARPYNRVFTPDPENGGFSASILEFPGCVSQGETIEEANQNLEDAAEGWIEASWEAGQGIPAPVEPPEYSGKIALRLPRSLHRQAVQMAEREGVSLNQFLVATIAERLGAEKTLLAFRRWNLQYAANVGELMQGRIQDMVVYRAPERGASAAMVANIQVRDVWKAPRQEGEKQRA